MLAAASWTLPLTRHLPTSHLVGCRPCSRCLCLAGSSKGLPNEAATNLRQPRAGTPRCVSAAEPGKPVIRMPGAYSAKNMQATANPLKLPWISFAAQETAPSCGMQAHKRSTRSPTLSWLHASSDLAAWHYASCVASWSPSAQASLVVRLSKCPTQQPDPVCEVEVPVLLAEACSGHGVATGESSHSAVPESGLLNLVWDLGQNPHMAINSLKE